jgi:hypothetical protein
MTRRQRGVAGARSQLALELLHPRLELLNAAIHRQQHLDDGLSPRIVDRLCLGTLHAIGFDRAELCPPGLNGYKKAPITRAFLHSVGGIRTRESCRERRGPAPAALGVQVCSPDEAVKRQSTALEAASEAWECRADAAPHGRSRASPARRTRTSLVHGTAFRNAHTARLRTCCRSYYGRPSAVLALKLTVGSTDATGR